jgi:glycosyltransferase involved in cell wall biosynthesis
MQISVLVNNFNNAPYLEQCLASVFSQIPPPDDVVFYDDGSTDESLAVAAKFAGKLTIIAGSRGTGSPIQNQARAIYEAFRRCSGDLVFLLDADDVFLPGKLAAYTAEFSQDARIVMVQAPLIKINREGKPIGLEFEKARHQKDYLAHIYESHELNIYYPTSALAFRRPYLDRRLPLNSGQVQPVWPDAQLALLAPFFGRVVALPKPYTLWRRHPRSHTVMKPYSIYQLVRFNQDYFNSFCRVSGRESMAPWRSRPHLLRWLRHYFVMEIFVEMFRKVRWWFMSDEKKREMLQGPDLAALHKLVDS